MKWYDLLFDLKNDHIESIILLFDQKNGYEKWHDHFFDPKNCHAESIVHLFESKKDHAKRHIWYFCRGVLHTPHQDTLKSGV